MFPALSINWFELFALPQQFELTAEQFAHLTQRYRLLQTEYHPDRFAQAAEQEKRLAVQYSALLNEAYHTLMQPRARARYLLELTGLALNDERDTTHDAGFLMQQIEWRESIEEAIELPSTEAMATLDQLSVALQQDALALEKNFAQAWQQQQWNAAKAIYLKMRFYERLQEEVRRHLERLEDY